MKKRNFKLIISVIIMAIILFFIYNNFEKLYKVYIQLFHKNIIIAHYNSKKQLNGNYIVYLNGRVYIKSYFKNGLREGLSIWYDKKTGNETQEVFYKRGLADGIEKGYYENGSLNYTTQWIKGKVSKSGYRYSNNGILNTYMAFDKSKEADNSYCYVVYDKEGDFHQISGDVFSSFIYSTCKDSIVALSDNSKYTCAKDLFISVATPPRLTPIVDIFINNAKYTTTSIKENTMIIPNIFKAVGTYQIAIYGKLLNSRGRIVKADTLKTIIIKG